MPIHLPPLVFGYPSMAVPPTISRLPLSRCTAALQNQSVGVLKVLYWLVSRSYR